MPSQLTPDCDANSFHDLSCVAHCHLATNKHHPELLGKRTQTTHTVASNRKPNPAQLKQHLRTVECDLPPAKRLGVQTPTHQPHSQTPRELASGLDGKQQRKAPTLPRPYPT